MSDGLRLISSIIASGSARTLIDLDRDMFLDTEVECYDFARGFFRTYRELPQAQTVRAETGIALPGAPESMQFYLDQVTDRKTYNEVREHYATMRAQLSNRDIPGIADTVEAMVRTTRRRQRGTQVVTLGEGLQQVVDRLEGTRGLGGITGVETGWTSFDEITGGYQDSDLISIIGRPSLGKTYVLLKQAEYSYLSGKSVLFVTTEMGSEQIARRYASLNLGIDPERLKRNMISTYMERRLRGLITGLAGNDRFRIFSVGMGAKISSIEALIQEFGPDIVYIDGTYLLHPSAKGTMKRIERVGEVFDELKGLNIDAGIPFVNTMQFNRQAGKDGKDGSLETIGFSDAVGMHSSLVIALKHGPTENPRESREMEFMKGREGEIGSVAINFKFAPVDFTELQPDQLATTTEPGADVGWMASSTI